MASDSKLFMVLLRLDVRGRSKIVLQPSHTSTRLRGSTRTHILDGAKARCIDPRGAQVERHLEPEPVVGRGAEHDAEADRRVRVTGGLATPLGEKAEIWILPAVSGR